MGVRRYGAHACLTNRSLSTGTQRAEKLVVAHLGNGASIAAIRNGRGLDTSMGLTPLAASSAAHAPATSIPAHCCLSCARLRRRRRAPPTLRQAGGGSQQGIWPLGRQRTLPDMRDLRDAIAHGNAKARLAVEKFTWTIAKWIGGTWPS